MIKGAFYQGKEPDICNGLPVFSRLRNQGVKLPPCVECGPLHHRIFTDVFRLVS